MSDGYLYRYLGIDLTSARKMPAITSVTATIFGQPSLSEDPGTGTISPIRMQLRRSHEALHPGPPPTQELSPTV